MRARTGLWKHPVMARSHPVPYREGILNDYRLAECRNRPPTRQAKSRPTSQIGRQKEPLLEH